MAGNSSAGTKPQGYGTANPYRFNAGSTSAVRTYSDDVTLGTTAAKKPQGYGTSNPSSSTGARLATMRRPIQRLASGIAPRRAMRARRGTPPSRHKPEEKIIVPKPHRVTSASATAAVALVMTLVATAALRTAAAGKAVAEGRGQQPRLTKPVGVTDTVLTSRRWR